MARLAADDERRLAQLVLRAGELESGERDGYLLGATGGNSAILAEARRRLAAAGDLDSNFLGRPLVHLLELSQRETEPETTVALGTNIGCYRLVEWLGRGGMGEVYEARDESRDRAVAIKHIRSDLAGDPLWRERFWHEARALAQLGHPAIVRILDFLEVDGGEWIVMELVAGQTLAELMIDDPLDVDQAIDAGQQVASALAAAHARGIIHRDLKTENVMVLPSGRIKVLDFGLARRCVSPTAAASWAHGTDGDPSRPAPGPIVGTPRAMAPEQVEGRSADARSDLFSLGVLLYEVLTGHSPFHADTPFATLERVMRHHPPPARRLNRQVSRSLTKLVGQLLEKDPARRGDGAGAVARALAAMAAGGRSRFFPRPAVKAPAMSADSSPVALRFWPPPELPELPYPVLLPYSHPALLAGREAEITELRDRLRMRPPIVGLHGPSGIGKSSLLLGGLVPMLRAEGQPVALVRHPREPGVARRLAGDLLVGQQSLADEDRRGFLECLQSVEHAAARPAVLVIDQFEDVLKSAAGSAVLGGLLQATVAPDRGDAPCRWLLAYRQEFQGAVEVWLQEVVGAPRSRDRQPGFFHSLALPPLATPQGSLSGDEALEDATRIFLAAIEKPLEARREDGTRRYPWQFAPEQARRLARAFAEERIRQPGAPLVPELQVVLAHLMAKARAAENTVSILELSEDPGGMIAEALDDHLRRALKTAFPESLARRGEEVRARRARALLALGELAARRERGLGAGDLTRAIGAGGEEALAQLATPLTRLVVLQQRPEGLRYTFSHDRMAEAVARLVAEEGRDEFLLDAELLALRRFVALKTALHRSGERQATRIPRRHFRRISANSEALLWDSERRAWFAACRKRRYADQRRLGALAAQLVLILTLVGGGAWTWAHRRAEHRALLEQVAEGEPEVALQALVQLATRPDADSAELRELLERRDVPMDILERGLGGLDGAVRSNAVLRAVEIALPWVEETPVGQTPSEWEYPVLIANLVWALDAAPGRDPAFAERAHALRQRVLEPLRRSRPPPPVPELGSPIREGATAQDRTWIYAPAGSFQMGKGPDEDGADDERMRHEVTVSAFRMQRHEVTNAEYRRLVPDHEGADGMPAAFVTWYAAYVYAAWLGGRLPTEAEWEYAARAGCPHAYCTRDGEQTSIDTVAWTQRNSRDAATGDVVPHPVMQLEPNPWGYYDLLGNLAEWTADWHGEYPDDPQRDPWGHVASGWRVARGGTFRDKANAAHVASRDLAIPYSGDGFQGFRVVLPGE